MGRRPKFRVRFELKFSFSARHFSHELVLIILPVRCAVRTLIQSETSSRAVRDHVKIIAYTEEKTATPKKQIIIKMVSIRSAENVQNTHEV